MLGVPVLYLYIFVAWAALIALAAAIAATAAIGRRRSRRAGRRSDAVERPRPAERRRAMLSAPVIVIVSLALSRPAVRHRQLRRQARRRRPQHHRHALHLRAVDRGLLHVVDVLRLGRPGGVERRRLPADLPRPDADVHPRLDRHPQDHPHHQGQPHHLDRRLHRLALRQELRARHRGQRHRRGRHPALHLAAAEGDLDQLLDPAAVSRDPHAEGGCRRARSCRTPSST